MQSKLKTAPRARRRGALLFVAAALALVAIPGCLGPSRALPTAADLCTPTASAPYRAQLDRGRQILMTSCADCHGVPYPEQETPSAWPAVVNKMGARAGLSPDDRSDLLAYLQAAARNSNPAP